MQAAALRSLTFSNYILGYISTVSTVNSLRKQGPTENQLRGDSLRQQAVEMSNDLLSVTLIFGLQVPFTEFSSKTGK